MLYTRLTTDEAGHTFCPDGDGICGYTSGPGPENPCFCQCSCQCSATPIGGGGGPGWICGV
jgi:hypothetical protein